MFFDVPRNHVEMGTIHPDLITDAIASFEKIVVLGVFLIVTSYYSQYMGKCSKPPTSTVGRSTNIWASAVSVTWGVGSRRMQGSTITTNCRMMTWIKHLNCSDDLSGLYIYIYKWCYKSWTSWHWIKEPVFLCSFWQLGLVAINSNISDRDLTGREILELQLAPYCEKREYRYPLVI